MESFPQLILQTATSIRTLHSFQEQGIMEEGWLVGWCTYASMDCAPPLRSR